jgi:hypothetical protein
MKLIQGEAMSMLSDAIVAHIYAQIEEHGYSKTDFALKPGPMEEHEGEMTELVTATYVRTGKVRPYLISRNSVWTFLLETDLRRGAFL